MFALRRCSSSLRLVTPTRLAPATRVLFLRPPRTVGYSDLTPTSSSPSYLPNIQTEDTQPTRVAGILTSVLEEYPDDAPPAEYDEEYDEDDFGPPPDSAPLAVDTPGLEHDFVDYKPLPAYRFHCNSSRNNTISSFTDPDGNMIAWFSGGSCGFRKRNRSSYEAGYQCAVRMFAKIEEMGRDMPQTSPMRIDLFCKGFGQGREALFKALTTAQGDQVRSWIVSITDRTPIKIGGTRSKKLKRR